MTVSSCLPPRRTAGCSASGSWPRSPPNGGSRAGPDTLVRGRDRERPCPAGWLVTPPGELPRAHRPAPVRRGARSGRLSHARRGDRPGPRPMPSDRATRRQPDPSTPRQRGWSRRRPTSSRGRGAIEAFWQAGLDAGVVDVELDAVTAERRGQMAYELGRYALLCLSGCLSATQHVETESRDELRACSGLRRRRELPHHLRKAIRHLTVTTGSQMVAM